jgi:hypothetical protein
MIRRKMTRLLSLFSAGALLVSSSAIAGTEVEDQIEQKLLVMQVATGDDYVRARSELLELSDAGREALDAKRERARFSEKTWREDVVVDAALLWAKNPAIAERAYALEGLKPARYLKKRRPEPEVSIEVRRLKLPAPVLFELELKTRDSYPYAERNDYPKTFEPETIEALRAKERLALRTAVLAGIARSKHPAAPHLLREVVLDRAEDPRVRRTAAIGLGQTNAIGVVLVLAGIAEDPGEPEILRSGAIGGLGQVRSIASLEVLARIASRQEDHLRRTAVVSIGTLANAWVLRNHSVESRELLRDRASQLLIELLGQPAQDHSAVIEAMVMVSNPGLRAELASIAEDAGRAEALRALASRAVVRLDLAKQRGS